jgi:hypothetical protein
LFPIEQVNNEVSANTQSGSGLATKINNALSALPGGGVTRVNSPDGRGAWTWGSDLTIDPTAYNGVLLDIGPGTVIEYGGSGWALTLDSGGNDDAQSKDGKKVHVVGDVESNGDRSCRVLPS